MKKMNRALSIVLSAKSSAAAMMSADSQWDELSRKFPLATYNPDHAAYNRSVNWSNSLLNPRRGFIVDDILTIVRSFIMPPLMLNVCDVSTTLFSIDDFVNRARIACIKHGSKWDSIRNITFDDDTYFVSGYVVHQFNSNDRRFYYDYNPSVDFKINNDAKYLGDGRVAIAADKGLRIRDEDGFNTVRDTKFQNICVSSVGELFGHTGSQLAEPSGGYIWRIDLGGSDSKIPIDLCYYNRYPLSPWRGSNILIAHGGLSVYDGQVTTLASSGEYNNVTAYDENYVFLNRCRYEHTFLIDIRMGVSARSLVGAQKLERGQLLTVKPRN